MSDTKTETKNEETKSPIPDHFRTASEYRSDLEGAAEKIRGLRAVDADKRDDAWKADLRATNADLMQNDLELRAVEQFHALSLIDQYEQAQARVAAAQRGAGGPSAAMAFLDGGEYRTAGEIFVESDEYKARTGSKTNEVQVRTLITSGTSSNDGGVWLPKAQPLPPRPRTARLFVRDLLSVQQTTMASIPYIREYTPATTEVGASSVVEGGLKPEVAALFETVDAPARKIAGWLPVTSEVVEDAPTLKGYIDTRLVYMLMLREEQQVLNGSGTAPQLQGIRGATGVQTAAFVTGDPVASIGNAIGKVEAVDGDADGIAIHPTDFWELMVLRHSSQLDFGYSGNLPYGAPPNTLWGVRCVRTRSATADEAIVGSWALGATLFEREAPTVRTLDQHSDYAIYNKLVILGEERVALAIHRPDFFVKAALA